MAPPLQHSREKPSLDPDATRLGAESDRLNWSLRRFWRRHAWHYRETRRLLAEGAIGEPQLLRSRSGCGAARLPRSGRPRWHRRSIAACASVISRPGCAARRSRGLARGAPTREEIAAVGDVDPRRVCSCSPPVSHSRTCAHGRVRRGRAAIVASWRARLRGARELVAGAPRGRPATSCRRPTTCCSTPWRARSTRSPQPWLEARCPTRRVHPTPQPPCARRSRCGSPGARVRWCGFAEARASVSRAISSAAPLRRGRGRHLRGVARPSTRDGCGAQDGGRERAWRDARVVPGTALAGTDRRLRQRSSYLRRQTVRLFVGSLWPAVRLPRLSGSAGTTARPVAWWPRGAWRATRLRHRRESSTTDRRERSCSSPAGASPQPFAWARSGRAASISCGSISVATRARATPRSSCATRTPAPSPSCSRRTPGEAYSTWGG